MFELARSSALQNSYADLKDFENDHIRLSAGPQLTKLKLQCRPDAALDLSALADVVGNSLPTNPREIISGKPAVFWTAPNDWLLVTEEADSETLSHALAQCLSAHNYAIIDVSDSLAVIELGGDKSHELLAEGCGIDLHPASFQKGCYAATQLAQLSVIIHRIDENNMAFHLYAERSTALHLWQWLLDGAGQFEPDDP